jgi:enterochelin esterase-like enzyme
MVLGQFDSNTGNRIRYRVYLPPCYSDAGRTYPTLYMLPGNVHTESIWDELGLDEAAEEGIARKDLPPFMTVMVAGGPLANNTSGGPGSYETFFFDEFVPYVEATYCAWPDASGRAIGGMSRGGYWALEIAFRHADAFASVGGHSAALLDFNGGPTVNPLDTGLNNDLGELRVYLDIGEDDWLIDNVRSLHDQMAAGGIEHTWILNEGYHEDGYWAAHVTEYLAWYTAPWSADAEAYPPCRTKTVESPSS